MTDLSWPEGKTLALSIVVNIEEGSEMTIADGDKKPEPVDELGVALSIPIRNYGNESNYRYGITTGGPRLFRLLGHYGVPATVTAAALALELAPELTAQIPARATRSFHADPGRIPFSMKEERERETISAP